MTKNIPANTAEVRAYFNENPKRVPENDKTVGPKSAQRGRLSKAAKATFTEDTGRVYAEGHVGQASLVEVTYKHEQKSGRKVSKTVTLKPSEVRALAGVEATHGRLSDSAKEAASEALAARSTSEAEAARTA